MANPPIEYNTVLGKYNKSSKKYLEIRLPQEIEEIEDLKPALRELHRIKRENSSEDKTETLFPRLVTPDTDSDDQDGEENEEEPAYIRIDFEAHSRHDLVIKADEAPDKRTFNEKTDQRLDEPDLTENLRYYMSIPAEFTHHRSESPIHRYEEGDEVTLELDQEDNHMRIYTPEDYRYREKELSESDREPVRKKLTATGLTLDTRDGYTALRRSNTEQKVRLIPFSAQHEVFQGELRFSRDGHLVPSLDGFHNVLEQGEIPTCGIVKLIIKWSTESIHEYLEGGWTDVKDANPNQVTLYTDYFVNEENLTLPSKGEYEIITETVNGKNRAWLTYSSSGSDNHDRLVEDNWYTKYYERKEDEEELTVYIPCNSVK